jgi:hypothetical protein
MTPTLPVFARTALAVCASTALLAAPAFAQATNQGSSGAERGAARAEGGGGSAPAAAPHANSAPSAPSGGSSGGGGATASGGGATGGGGSSVPRSGGDRSGSGARATGGSGSGGGYSGSNAPAPRAGGHEGNGRAVPRDGGTVTGTSTGSGGGDVPTYARPREGHAPVGTAVPRGTVPPPPTGGGGGIYYPGYYPGGYYDPWGYGGYGAGYYGGYYGGYYDPWYGGYPTTPQATYSSSSDEGALKLKIKPRQAEVYVDGYFVGVVDDFDGMFQRLHIESGAHRIEVRAGGYENLDFDVRITPEHTTTYTGEMKKIQ